MSTILDDRTEQTTRETPSEPGDHERLSHYVNKDAYMQALVDGIPITALCGKSWLPTRDGTKFPVCPECKEIWEGMEDA